MNGEEREVCAGVGPTILQFFQVSHQELGGIINYLGRGASGNVFV